MLTRKIKCVLQKPKSILPLQGQVGRGQSPSPQPALLAVQDASFVHNHGPTFPQFLLSKIPSLASRTFTTSIYHFMHQFVVGSFSKAEKRDSGCNLASSPKLKGSSYRISEMPPP